MFCFQGGLPTIGDIYDIVLETEKGTHERIQIFDTPGWVMATLKSPYYCAHFFQLFDGTNADLQDHYLLLADGFVLVYEITSKASYELVTSIRTKIASKNKEV